MPFCMWVNMSLCLPLLLPVVNIQPETIRYANGLIFQGEFFPHCVLFSINGAGDGNRTRVISLEG